MEIILKSFQELTTEELYELLQLRNDVFILEQNCHYRDLDDYDQKSSHLFFKIENEMTAYCRIFAPDVKYPNSCSIGRVLVKQNFRKKALGIQLMEEAIQFCKTHFPSNSITISAQTYLEKFYSDLDFKSTDNRYLEDEIPHVQMVLG